MYISIMNSIHICLRERAVLCS